VEPCHEDVAGGHRPYEELKARSLAIARGEVKPLPDEPKVWFTSTESFAKVLSASNRALLAAIAADRPASLTELAERTGRQKSNLSRTLKTMARYGFVTLRRDAGGRIVPEVTYDAIELILPLARRSQGQDAAA
jgi:predicted transcriptional regulator